MRGVIFIAVAGFTMPSYAFDDAAVVAKCDADWGTDFEMVAYCRKNQREAGQIVDELDERASGDTAVATIMAGCRSDWGKDYEMINYCYKQQANALTDLQIAPEGVPNEIVEVIMEGCRADWSGNFEMVAYCRNQQITAWKELK